VSAHIDDAAHGNCGRCTGNMAPASMFHVKHGAVAF